MFDSHAEMVANLKKPGHEVLRHLNPERVDLWHAVTGVMTEAGELLDAVKKLVIYNKMLDHANCIEELGDLEFYMEQVRQAIGVDRETVLRANMHKLWTRYGATYSDAAAQARADKSA